MLTLAWYIFNINDFACKLMILHVNYDDVKTVEFIQPKNIFWKKKSEQGNLISKYFSKLNKEKIKCNSCLHVFLK